MPFPDPALHADFIALADKYAADALSRAEFEEQCRALLQRHSVILPDREDCELCEPQR